jgi:hypothetical protein
MPVVPTLPPVAGSQNAGIHSATGGPALDDLGVFAQFVGCIITNLKTAFPLTQDTYHDEFMIPKVDVVYGQGLEITYDCEVHNRNTTGGAPDTDPNSPTMTVGSILDARAVQVLGTYSHRGFGKNTPDYWQDGTQFIVTEAPGTFERQKLRKDSVKLVFRRYSAVALP